MFQFIDRPVGGHLVRHFLVVVGKHTPIPQGMPMGLGDFLFRPRPKTAVAPAVFGKELFVLPVKNLADRHGVIALACEVFWEREHTLKCRCLGERRAEEVDTGRVRIASGQQTGSGWVTDRGLAMGVGEQRASLGKSIDVGSSRLRVPAQTSDPVIEIVDGDQ